jgi:spore germination cell wall hydrolase CwlJ-like protein
MKSLLFLVMVFNSGFQCMSENVYYEARNQPFIGQVAVADVTFNRIEDDRWPDSACEVVNQRKQFSWTATKHKKPYGPAWVKAQLAVLESARGPSIKATHFHATYVDPYWAPEQQYIVTIGDHIFYD